MNDIPLETQLQWQLKMAALEEDAEKQWGRKIGCESWVEHWHNDSWAPGGPLWSLTHRTKETVQIGGVDVLRISRKEKVQLGTNQRLDCEWVLEVDTDLEELKPSPFTGAMQKVQYRLPDDVMRDYHPELVSLWETTMRQEADRLLA